jgi:hypothetical protein
MPFACPGDDDGLALTLVFPRFAHANWVLLTIALIMRANYSVTSQRRWDRVTGTLIGCALAVTFINTLPAPALLLFIVMAVGTSHAYGQVAYRITGNRRLGLVPAAVALRRSAGASAILRTHRRYPDRLRPVLGVQLSVAHWERNDLPRTVKGLLAADATFAEAALRRAPVSQPTGWPGKKPWMRWRSFPAPSAGWRTSPTPIAGPWRR